MEGLIKTVNNIYLFMEYCPQGTLEQLLQNGPLSEEEAMKYFVQIVKGMHALNMTGIVHRDLKSANLLLSGKIVKIGDFGLAKKYNKESMLTSYKGTPLNMAP